MHMEAHIFRINFAGMKYRVLLVFLLAFTALAEAQFRHMFDTIRYDLKQKKSFFVCLDGKNSVIRDMPVNMFGLQAGYTFNKRTNLFTGFYRSYNDEKIAYNPTAKSGQIDSSTEFLRYRLTYLNIGCEYYFHNSNKWRFSIPFSIGIGGGKEVRRYNYKEISRNTYTVAPVELGFYAHYKLTWWVWPGAGIGTRVSLANRSFNGPYYTYGFSFRLGEIYERGKKQAIKWHLIEP